MAIATKKPAEKATVKKSVSFSSLTKAQQRVQIAKDTLKWINTKSLKVTPGAYVEIIKGIDKLNVGDKLDEKLPEITCEVCAKGALFLAHVDRFDKCTIKGYCGELSIYEFNDEGRISARLSSHFSQLQLDMIEAAFEKSVQSDKTNQLEETGWDNWCPTPLGAACIKFGKQYRTPKKRLIAILENIIKNEGKFKP